MPTYEYRCSGCGHEFEQFQPITEDPISECPQCKEKPQRLISGGGGLLFKGSGFYTTDYRSKAYKDQASKDKPATDSSSSSDSSNKKTGSDSGSAKKSSGSGSTSNSS